MGVAYEFRVSLRRGTWRNTSVFQRMRPVLRSSPMIRHDSPLSVVVVTKTRFPCTIGEDHASPGISVFHAKWSVADQVVGTELSLE